MPREGNSFYPPGIALHRLFPTTEIYGSGERCEGNKLRKCEIRALGHRGSSLESLGPVAGQAEDVWSYGQ